LVQAYKRGEAEALDEVKIVPKIKKKGNGAKARTW
jgi:hypothetical protein